MLRMLVDEIDRQQQVGIGVHSRKTNVIMATEQLHSTLGYLQLPDDAILNLYTALERDCTRTQSPRI